MGLHRLTSAHQDQYVSDLRAAYLGLRLYDPDDAFAQDPLVWDKMLRDPVIRHAVQDRCYKVAGRKWQMRPASDDEADKAVAGIVEELLGTIRGFTAARYRLAQGVFHGRSYAYINGERRVLAAGDFPVRRWWVPCRLEQLDARGVRFVPEWDALPDGSRHVRRVTEVRSLDGRRWIRPSVEDLASLVQVVYADEESRLGYGRGLQESIYFYFYAIWKVLEEGLSAVERWGQGVLVGKVKPKKGRTNQTSEEMADEMLDVLNRMRARHGVVVDPEDEITMLWPSGTGHQMIVDFLKYLHQQVTRLITGALLPTGGAPEAGSKARAETESDEAEAMIQFDREVIDEALTDCLVAQVWRVNRANFVALGLGDARMPWFSTIQEKKENPAENAQVAATLLNAGVPLKVAEIMEKTGFTPPKRNPETGEWEEDVIEGRAPVSPLDAGAPGLLGGQAA